MLTCIDIGKPDFKRGVARKRPILDDTSLRSLLALDDPQLAHIDPLEMNLRVACGIPQLADLDIPRYQSQADEWANSLRKFIQGAEPEFHKEPEYWENDVDFFRLGCLCQFVACTLGVRYIEEQREISEIE